MRQIEFGTDDAPNAGTIWSAEKPAERVIVLAHGLGGTQATGLAPYAERFVDAGYTALTFDYRHHGKSAGSPRQVIDLRRQLEDWRRAIAFARRGGLGFRPTHLALWGTSLSGGHVLRLAADGAAVDAVVAQCPVTDGLWSAVATGPVSASKVSALALMDLAAASRGRPPVYVPTAGVRGDAALMTAPDAVPGVQRLAADDPDEFDARAAARVAMQIGLYRPGRRLGRIAVPTLIQVCKPDTVAPDRVTMRHIERAGNPLITAEPVPFGHFDIYHEPAFTPVVARQLAFLDQHC